MAVRPPEISYEPYFYPPRDNVVFPELIIAPHRQDAIARARKTIRYDYLGYKPVILDNLEAHIHRVVKRGLVLPYIGDQDRLAICDMLEIHDGDEFGEEKDLTTPDKTTSPEAAALALKRGELNVERELSQEDRLLWKQYQRAKLLLEGDPRAVAVGPNMILAKLVDVVENETYFHTWFHYLYSLHQDQVFDLLPSSAFRVSFPRLMKYRQNIVNLGLPEAHMQVAQEFFNEIEAFARISGQKED